MTESIEPKQLLQLVFGGELKTLTEVQFRDLEKLDIVGIFPEGGVAQGSESIFRGGIVKEGACLIAQRARVPIVPVVVLGTEKLNCVDPWLPMRRGKLWLNVGRPLDPILDISHRRSARKQLAGQLRQRFIETYQELLQTCRLDDTIAP